MGAFDNKSNDDIEYEKGECDNACVTNNMIIMIDLIFIIEIKLQIMSMTSG